MDLTARTLLARGGEVLAVLVVLSLLAGNVLGQPVLLSYVETGSMEPTIDASDGFVAVPAAVAGPVESGDIVVFEAQRLNGGGLTTHRVVGETERGYVTKGDANPFPDQDGSEPPVKEAQIVATALQVGGQPVVIPNLGTAITTATAAVGLVGEQVGSVPGLTSQGGVAALGVLVVGGAAVLLSGGDSRRSRGRSRGREETIDTGRLVLLSAVLLLVATTAGMVVPGGTTTYGVVSAESDAPGARVIPTGETETAPYPLRNGGVMPVAVFLEPASEGIDVTPEAATLGPRASANATVAITAPPRTGYYRRFLTEHRYIAILPVSTIESLYRVHPWLPIAVIDGIVVGGYLVVVRAVVGTGTTIRQRARGRSRTREGG